MSEENCCNQQEDQIQTLDIQEDSQEIEIQWYSNKKENAENRFSVCQNCDELLPLVNVCKQCGCLMKKKTRIYSASCPLNKW